MKDVPPAIATGGQSVQWSLKTLRTAFLLLLILSCAPAIVHFRLVNEVFESLRCPTGLLPGVYLFLREFGQISIVFPLVLVAAVGWSLFRPVHTAKLLTIITSAFLAFTVAYLCWGLVVVYLLAHNRGTQSG